MDHFRKEQKTPKEISKTNEQNNNQLNTEMEDFESSESILSTFDSSEPFSSFSFNHFEKTQNVIQFQSSSSLFSSIESNTSTFSNEMKTSTIPKFSEDYFTLIFKQIKGTSALQFSLKKLLKIVYSLNNYQLLDKYSQIIIFNMIQYGSQISYWKEMKELEMINRLHLQNIINVICFYYKTNQIVIRSVSIVKMKKIIREYNKFHSFNETFINDIKKLHWPIDFVISLMNEIILHGLFDYNLLLENQIIRKYLSIEFGSIFREKQDKIIKSVVNRLCIIVYCNECK